MSLHEAWHDDLVAGVDDASFHGNFDIGANVRDLSIAENDRAVFDGFAGHRNDFRTFERQGFLCVQIRSRCQCDDGNSGQKGYLFKHV